MSKADYPYDNAQMDRYLNTLRTDLIYQLHYQAEKEFYATIEEFAYGYYNNIRLHAYNKYEMHYEERYGVE